MYHINFGDLGYGYDNPIGEYSYFPVYTIHFKDVFSSRYHPLLVSTQTVTMKIKSEDCTYFPVCTIHL